MPYPNEHSARVAEPLPSNSAVYARKTISPGISIILQKSRGDANTPMRTQSYRFGRHQFSPEEAKDWLRKHNIKYLSFEPASDSGDKETRQDVVNRITKELAGAII